MLEGSNATGACAAVTFDPSGWGTGLLMSGAMTMLREMVCVVLNAAAALLAAVELWLAFLAASFVNSFTLDTMKKDEKLINCKQMTGQ